jgi:hypothetical protein
MLLLIPSEDPQEYGYVAKYPIFLNADKDIMRH